MLQMFHHEIESTTTTAGAVGSSSTELQAYTNPKSYENFSTRLYQEIENIRKYQLNTDLSAKEKV
jgi:hypothetical protein